jgi:DGQHR domain-containing protein
MYDVRRAIRKERRYKNISDVRFILATTKVGIRKEDSAFANKIPKVYVWDGNFLQYYKTLQQGIGDYAKYNLLSEIEIWPTQDVKIRIPCMRMRIYGRKLYSFFVLPRHLLKFSYVARREMAKEEYYQRFVDKGRIKQIAQEFLDKRGIFPNSVVLAFNKPPKFTPLKKSAAGYDRAAAPGSTLGYLTLPSEYRSCWVIDGQHRLYAFAHAHSGANQKISVIAFDHLSLREQARYFVEINSNQKPVQADLLWDLKGDLFPESADGIISRVVKRLNLEGEMRGRIWVPSAGMKSEGKLLKFSGMCTNIKRRKLTEKRTEYMRLITDHNPIYHSKIDLMINRLYNALNEYFFVANRVFSSKEKKEFWMQNSGIAILIALYECIIRRIGDVPDKTELRLYMKALVGTFRDGHDDVKLLRLRCNSEGGRSELAREFAARIATVLGDRQFRVPSPESEFEERISKFERDLARFLVLKMTQAPTEIGDWKKERLPRGVLERLSATLKESPGDISDHLTLGECRDILQMRNNWALVEDTFIHAKGFPTKEHFMIALDYVVEHRNAAKHGRPLKPAYSNITMRDQYFQELVTCLAASRESLSASAHAKRPNEMMH